MVSPAKKHGVVYREDVEMNLVNVEMNLVGHSISKIHNDSRHVLPWLRLM